MFFNEAFWLWAKFREVVSDGYEEGSYLAAINLVWDRYNAEQDAKEDSDWDPDEWYGT